MGSEATLEVWSYAGKLHVQAHRLRTHNATVVATEIDHLAEQLLSNDMNIDSVVRAIARMRDLRPGLKDYDLLPDAN